MIDRKTYQRVFKALCDDKRLQIIELLQNGEKCACVIAEHINVSQSALSYHMRILCESGIVLKKETGKWIHYRLSETGINYAKELLNLLIVNNSNDDQVVCRISS